MKMKQIMMLLAAMLLTACSKDDEVKAATVQEAGKTLVVYYSYTNNCHEIVTSLTSQGAAECYQGCAQRCSELSGHRSRKYHRPLAVPEHHHRHAPVVEPDGGHHADVPV